MDYCAQIDIEGHFGAENVAKWADLDNDKDATKIAARIAKAIAWASATIDDRLRNGPYRTPLVGDSCAPDLPVTVSDLAATLAGTWLYRSRGIVDTDANGFPTDKYAAIRKDAERMLEQIRSGVLTLDCLPARKASACPVAVRDPSPRRHWPGGFLP